MHSALPTNRNELFIHAVHVKVSVQLKQGSEQSLHIPLYEYISGGHYTTHCPRYCDLLLRHVMH